MAESFFILLTLAILAPISQSVTIVKEVNIGELAELHCPSNDDNHRFQFWQLQRENLVIGPTNQFNKDKYKYEVLTGTLFIRGVSSNENGVYTCVCKHVTDNSFYSENVELIVKKDWEEVYETDPYTNVFRIVLTVSVMMVVMAGALFLYSVRMNRSTKFTALADEESADEAGPSYKLPTADGRLLSSLDTHELDTELPRPTIFNDIRLNNTNI